MKEYLIIIAADNKRGLSQSEEQHCIQEYGKWAAQLAEKHVTARRLSLDEGVFVPKKKSLTTDGPFIEAKELIAGIVLIEADSIAKAKEVASSCPLNEYFHLYVKETN